MAAACPIHPGMTVHLLDGGTLTVVAVRRAGGAPSLVLRTGALYGRQVMVPYSAVSYGDGGMHLRLSAREVQALPTFNSMPH